MGRSRLRRHRSQITLGAYVRISEHRGERLTPQKQEIGPPFPTILLFNRIFATPKSRRCNGLACFISLEVKEKKKIAVAG